MSRERENGEDKKLIQVLFPFELYNMIRKDASDSGNSVSATVRQRLRERYEQLDQREQR
jgi:hypothetical protein